MISAQTLAGDKDGGGYKWLMLYFCSLASIGFLLNAWLYQDDIANRGGVLNAIEGTKATSRIPHANEKDSKYSDQEDEDSIDASLQSSSKSDTPMRRKSARREAADKL